tara:strand:+ start:119574 stop:122441 length:2868 start_codon:yes stop_codon:yes gene_type:complete
MLLTDWLKCLSGTRSKFCAPPRIIRRQRARAAGVAEVSSQPETLENRTLLSAANILLTDVSGAVGFQITGASPGGTNFGSSIKPAGDVNGDGFEDVIVGAYYENVNAGAAYILFGKSDGFSPPPNLDDLKATDGFVIRGVNGGIPGPADYAGTAVSGAGDVNGDGFDDILVATARYSATADGAAGYVVFGKANNTEVNLSSIDAGASDSLGFRLTGFGSTPDFNAANAAATGGDLNGDGFDDIVFGGPRTNVGASYGVGAAYVVFGKENGFANLNISDLNGTNGFRFTDTQAVGDASNQAYIGSSVSIGGDINGDGLDDLIVGAPKFDYGAYNGRVFVVFGRTSFSATVEVNSLNGTTGFTATGVLNEKAATGAAVSSGGDVNGDGIDDFVVGAPGSDDYAHVAGRVYVVFGKTNIGSSGSLNLTQIAGSSGFILNGAANYDVAGTSVDITGDINGDGFDDVVIGAPTISSESTAPGANNGQAYVVFGRSNVSTTAPSNLSSLNGITGFRLSGSASYHAGQRVTSGVDLNGDGFDEIFIGEPYSTRGRVTVFFGTDFGLNNGVGGDGELGNGLQKIGDSTAETLTADAGSTAADILVGGGGNDTLISDGGSDVLIGGSGDDVLTANLANFSNPNVPRFDGGTGVDTLTGDASFSGASINLTEIPGNRINDIEVIDLEDSATQTLTLNLATVLAITGAGPTTASSSPFATNDAHTLVILRDADDTINIGTGWTQGANQTIDGETFEVFTQAGATVKIQSAIAVNGDVNGDNVYDFNDGILIALVKAFFPNSSIEANQGGTSLSAATIKANVNALNGESIFDVNEDSIFDFNDGILIALVKAFFPNSSIEANQGGTSLTATAIKANVNAIPSPPSGRLAPPLRLAEEASESAVPETPSFLPPAPAALLVIDESSASEAAGTDDPKGTTQTQRDSGSGANVDQAFITDQIDVSLNLLL